MKKHSIPIVKHIHCDAADEIGINMHTVNKAYAVLKQEGFLRLDRRRGAVIALDMDKLRTMEEMKNDLALIVARGICKNVGRDEIHSLVDQIYDEFGGQAYFTVASRFLQCSQSILPLLYACPPNSS